jgi:hypothetical protein
MAAESKKVEYSHMLSMWWLLLWRSILGLQILALISYVSLTMPQRGPNDSSPGLWGRIVAAIILIGALLLISFAAQLLIQQMIRKRYRLFLVSVIDNRSGEVRPNNHLMLLERFKIAIALLWRIAPIVGICWVFSVLLPRALGPAPLATLGPVGASAVLVLAPPLAVRSALRRRYSSFEVRVQERAGEALS